ncbi:hypothetical protein Pmar_PMAR006107 [Perkinsus marinus ATCC 50983]|uniref:Uncharacterized protein n=1 Tax=Perkinsus marinus (strain ATCC 50983 / TXsc) TaxID=423536 RepID=C5LA84_PERM5|nr:hypothetical protein Pmar_PMAR006107 [Perkinsus marinus ATCC 50983]EER06340.1 hypothetical protein Pmar_PMAR006107 [Perkinsus marinus ATCC 50983]|eukprot:XP_002774524.1 hypothetical protein Pmar_PMAR006107 [Perkinsus marinus ATCC 50983]
MFIFKPQQPEPDFPVSSGFHLDVAAILRMMGCHYEIEDKVMPFILDVTITANQAARVNSEEAARDGFEKEERASRVVEWLKAQQRLQCVKVAALDDQEVDRSVAAVKLFMN